ncbi:MAG: exodeoxyribonuclease VII large subunit, partial [Desulfobulbaceae bacterium]|nr:exodeoxyribonuclease VII large subunit [Desulfobulbaceae bacterium]
SDYTIADFVADLRAPTPSAAAELTTPDRRELGDKVAGLSRHLINHIQQQQQTLGTHITNLQQRLNLLHPGVQLVQRQQRVDELEQRLGLSLRSRMQHNRQLMSNLTARLQSQEPAKHISQLKQKTRELRHRMQLTTSNLHRFQEQRLAAVIRNMNALNPLATLERGYSITSRVSDGKIVDDATKLSAGDMVETRLAHGTILCLVESTKEP